MKKISYISVIIFLIGCNGVQQKPLENEIINDSIPNNEISINVDVQPPKKIEKTKNENKSIFITKLEKFYNNSDYYISLYYRTKYSESVANELYTKNVKIVVQGEEETRLRIDEKLAREHLLIDNIDSLLVFNGKQELIDTIIRKNYEYYDAMISSSLIATYTGKKDYKDNVVVSINSLSKFELGKSPEFTLDSNYLERLCLKFKLNPKYVFGSGLAVFNKDSISFISYSDYTKSKDCVYILKNGVVKDSIMEDYIIWDFKPVPLVNEKVRLYLASANVPETDIYWTSLIGIEKESFKLVFYDRNRYE